MEMREPRTIPARVGAEVADVTPDDLREFRRQGFLDGMGERVGAGHAFSPREIRTIALAVVMGRAGLGFDAAFEAVRNPASDIIAALSGAGGITLTFWPRRKAGAMSVACKIVIDASAIVSDASKRLDFALESERHRPRRRLSYGPVPAEISR